MSNLRQAISEMKEQADDILESCSVHGEPFTRLVVTMFEANQIAMIVGQVSALADEKHRARAKELWEVSLSLLTSIVVKATAHVEDDLLESASSMADVLMQKREEAMRKANL
jgi:predicted dinucleotide-utilizing enzyme